MMTNDNCITKPSNISAIELLKQRTTRASYPKVLAWELNPNFSTANVILHQKKRTKFREKARVSIKLHQCQSAQQTCPKTRVCNDNNRSDELLLDLPEVSNIFKQLVRTYLTLPRPFTAFKQHSDLFH